MIETAYRGYRITFDELDETWRCSDLEIPSQPKLAAVKRRIDELSKRSRRVEAEALMISRDRDDKGEIKTVKVTMLCEPEEGRHYRNEDAGLAVRHCWGLIDGERTKLRIEQLYPLDARPDLEAWRRLDDAYRKLDQEKADVLRAIKPHDADSLALAAKEQAVT